MSHSETEGLSAALPVDLFSRDLKTRMSLRTGVSCGLCRIEAFPADPSQHEPSASVRPINLDQTQVIGVLKREHIEAAVECVVN